MLKNAGLLLLITFSLATRAADIVSCSDKDFSQELGEVRKQGNIGWCYANAAADLISYKFRKQWNGFQASAIWIAFGYNYKQNSSDPGNYIFTEGGDIGSAIAYAAEYGYSCPRQFDNIFYNGGYHLEIKEKLHKAEDIKLLFDKRLKSPQDLALYQNYIKNLRDTDSIIKRLSDAELENALKLDINLAVIEIAKQVCAPYRLPMSIDRHADLGRYYKSDKEYYDDVLKKRIYNSSPPLMEILDRQITNGNAVGIGYTFDLISTDPKDMDGHASVIVGRRSRGASCQYKIRNSWGPGCSYVSGGKTYPRYGKKVVECVEDGHVWVNAKDLKASLDSITYLRP
jgi:hypothetical protein